MRVVIDTSAIMAILLNEPQIEHCQDCLIAANEIIISAGTLAEALIVATTRGRKHQLDHFIEMLGIQTIPLDALHANLASQAYQKWGKGNHPAGLNFGDCFAYSLARHLNLPLLFIGNDFSKTDIVPALNA